MDGAPMMVFARGSIFSRQRCCTLPLNGCGNEALCPAVLSGTAPAAISCHTCGITEGLSVSQSRLIRRSKVTCTKLLIRGNLTSHLQYKAMCWALLGVACHHVCLMKILPTHASAICKQFQDIVAELAAG